MKEFKTTLQGDGASVSYIEIPGKVMASFGGRIRVKVKASLNGVTYRTSIFSMGGCCGIPVRREIREKAKLQPGARVSVVLEEDLERREVEIPADLAREFRKSPGAQARFKKQSYTLQKEQVNAVLEAKRPETRASRIRKTVEGLKATR